MIKILVIDNYDSFTYNLVHYLREFPNTKVDVYRNDKIAIEKIEEYDGILISPGPGLPKDAGELMSILKTYKASKPILGICLGLQAIGELFGGKLENLESVFHGVATEIKINQPTHYLFEGLPESISAGRYHSWVVSNNQLPNDLKVEATDKSGFIMALSHTKFNICGLQFHPESILTPDGKQIIFNWLKRTQS
ncbi:anthranilate synthase component II [Perlabentimonas gracilis]|uniref:anthranilate synthase component II n=1 Tax=Perlabentimonas gracilis TaxID=2715279 RepID=UPI001C635AB9|nr:aminodeoxychorismate/anthranilate synthase component II [Perlabentimonas gracilis]